MNCKVLAFTVITGLSIALFSGCSADNGEDYIFKSVIYGNPDTLDPQTAADESSRAVIANTFRGLYRINEKGEVVPDMAEELEVSDDGLNWSFTIADNVYWTDGGDFEAVCTAYDFEFAFRRLLSPEVKSKNADKYYCIKNAENIHKGIITDITALGIKAESDKRLVITLEEKKPDFMRLLAAPSSMPCNEEFYRSTEGRYGLYDDAVAGNGDFYVTSWSYDKWSDNNNCIILRRNKANSKTEKISPYGLNFFIVNDSEKGFEMFRKGEIHCFASDNSRYSEEFIKKYSYEAFETVTYGIVFNGNTLGKERDFRIALGASAYLDINSDNFISANGIIPDCITFGGEGYRDRAGDITIPDYSEAELSERFEKGISGISKEILTNAEMIMPKNEELRKKLGEVLQKWQKDYGFYCSLTELDVREYKSRLENGGFDIAILSLSGEENSPKGYLSCFDDNDVINPDNRKFSHILSSAEKETDSSIIISYYKEAEQGLIDDFIFVPLCLEREYVFYSEGIEGIEYNPYNGIFRFKNALKK